MPASVARLNREIDAHVRRTNKGTHLTIEITLSDDGRFTDVYATPCNKRWDVPSHVNNLLAQFWVRWDRGDFSKLPVTKLPRGRKPKSA
jgi:hypothetical protein